VLLLLLLEVRPPEEEAQEEAQPVNTVESEIKHRRK
jgi:hypothetical protein